MRLFAWTAKQIICDGQSRRRSNEPDSVARRIQEAILDYRVVPIAARDGVVPGEKLAADDAYVLTPTFGRAAPMHAIPTADDFDVAKLHIIAHLKEDGVVRRIHDGQIPNSETTAIHKGDRVRSAHLLLAGWIENFVAIDDSRSCDCHILDILSDDQAAMPFAPSGFRH